MKKLLLLSLFFSLKAKALAPSWYGDHVKGNAGCEDLYLCVIGEGASIAEATVMARTEAAKFFQTKVKSTSQISASSEQKTDNPALGRYEEWTNKTVNEETSELISGLEIKRQEEINGHAYVLMILDRAKTANILREKMVEIDDVNQKIFERHTRFAFPRIFKNLQLIDAYKEKYELLTNAPLKLKVSRTMMEEKLNQLPPLKIALMTSGSKLPPKISHLLIEILSPLKVVIVKKKTNPKYTLRSELILEDLYMKVEGFKKLNVILRLELLGAEEMTMGKISAMSEQTGRSKEQAVEKAVLEIKDSLQENLDQLSIKNMED